jgi:hypothetical protein
LDGFFVDLKNTYESGDWVRDCIFIEEKSLLIRFDIEKYPLDSIKDVETEERDQNNDQVGSQLILKIMKLEI